MIRLIVAVDRKYGIAKNGVPPWHIPEDFAYFSRQTKLYGGHVLMGSKTIEIMGHTLKGRENFVLSRSNKDIEGVTMVSDLEAFIKDYEDADLWVIGGASIYEQVLSKGLADELYLTHIDADFDCDQFFPHFSTDDYKLYQQSESKQQNGFTYTYAIYKKVAP